MIATVALSTGGLMLAVGAAEARAPGDALFEQPYRSTAVIKDGEPHPLFGDTRVSLEFERRDDYDVMRWSARCNSFAARVEVRPQRLVTGPIIGTLIGCADRLHRQDGWLTRFFGRDPEWTRNAGKLKLRSRGDVIRFRRR